MGERHAKYFGASKHATWSACPGSVAVCAGLPNTSSVYSEEGTDAHTLAARCLEEGKPASDYVGEVLPLGNVVDDDMARYVQIYVDDVNARLKGANYIGYEDEIVYREPLGLSDPDDGFGTADASGLQGSTLVVSDLKFGRGKRVNVATSGQIRLYALGKYEELFTFELIDQVCLVIHQPRIQEESQEHIISVEDLLAFGAQTKEQVAEALQALDEFERHEGEAYRTVWEDKYLRPGHEQCQWCTAKATCRAKRNQVMAAIPDDYAAPALSNTDSEVLARLYPMLDDITAWCSAVRAELERRVFDGDTYLTGQFMIAEGRKGARAWASDADAEEALRTMKVKHDVMFKYQVISPTQAEKLAKAKVLGPRQWTKLQGLITQAKGKPSVVPISEGRTPMKIGVTAEDFAALPSGEVTSEFA